MRIILCCGSSGRAVVVGDVEKEPVAGEPVRLTDARMVLRWSTECGGLLGLAAGGPQTSTRVTHAVPVVVETSWQEWIALTDIAIEALDRWESV